MIKYLSSFYETGREKVIIETGNKAGLTKLLEEKLKQYGDGYLPVSLINSLSKIYLRTKESKIIQNALYDSLIKAARGLSFLEIKRALLAVKDMDKLKLTELENKVTLLLYC